MEWLADPNAWIALLTLTALEVVLGIDNIIFISILTGRLPQAQQARARNIGLIAAMVMRIGLLASLFWLSRLTEPLFSAFGEEFSARDLILIGGGLFLLAKSTLEIHKSVEGEADGGGGAAPAVFSAVIVQIMVIDIVFSLDSVITAIGMAEQLEVMAIAIVLAVLFMMFFAGTVSAFIDRHPTLKNLALSFLLMIGLALIGDGFGMHIPKGYLYFAMGFSVFVEVINLRARARRKTAAPA